MLTYYTVGGATMRNDAFLRITSSLVFGLALCAAGCGGDDSTGEGGDNGGPTVVEAPPFPEGTGQAAPAEKAYPPGPYGISVGSIIQPFTFIGYAAPMVNASGYQAINLAEFYNPTGTEVYAEGSLFPVGSPKPKALLMGVAAVWCGPCNQEADDVLPGKYAEYKPMGGEFFMFLGQDLYGGPATGKNLYNWTQKYDVEFPMGVDPTNKLGPLFEADAFPMNMIVDTRTMTIVEVVAGVPNGTFWSKYENLLQ